MISVRCSGLPLLFSCASSTDDPLLVDAHNEASGLGNAAHDAMRLVVRSLDPDLDQIARRWSVDRDDLGVMHHYGRQAWELLAASFPDPQTEAEVTVKSGDDFTLEGTIDLFSELSGGEVAILDWKTGRLDSDYFHQLAGYAACLILGHGATKVTATVVWLRDCETETYEFTRAEIEEWILRLVTQLSRRGKFTVGGHCQFCPRSHSCPAVREKARQSVALFGAPEWCADGVATTLDALPPSARVALYREAKLVSTLATSALAAIRLNVIQCGGELDGGDGKVLKIVEENGKRVLDTEKVWPLLEQHLDENTLPTVIDVSAAKFEDAVKAKAPARGGAAAVRALREEMEAAGAVFQPKVMKLVERRK